MNYKIKKLIFPIYNMLNTFLSPYKIKKYLKNPIPWSIGYKEYKHESIKKVINDNDLINKLNQNQLQNEYGIGIDERIIEYPLIFSELRSGKLKMLDAGSTFNFKYILSHPKIKEKELTIFTFYPEVPSYHSLASYVYGDLRQMPFNNEDFDIIVSHSTIEHIDMDNSIYGYDIQHQDKNIKSYEYQKAINEFFRTLKKGGQLIITFPFGKFNNYGMFQQLDSEMLNRIKIELEDKGILKIKFAKYTPSGWELTNEHDCSEIISYNPHTGFGKGSDGAAHCRAICFINFIKNN